MTLAALALAAALPLALAAGCGTAAPAADHTGQPPATAPLTPPAGAQLYVGATVLGAADCGAGPCALRVEGGRVVAAGPADEIGQDGDERIILDSGFLVPAFIDSHVHMAYLPEDRAMAEGGVAGAVDLAAPLDQVGRASPLVLRWAGPMLTGPGGYPTRSWGRNGYGCELGTADEVDAALARIQAAGATVVKSPAGSDGLAPALMTRAATGARAAGLPYAVHAMTDAEARAAAEAGATVFAHTPTAPLSAETRALWADRAVISTLAAFGGQPTTVETLRQLRAAGATVLYGTDFGNTRSPGISADELALLGAAGLDGAAILAAGTSAPAAFWGFEDLGQLGPGAWASMLWVATDPRADPAVLAAPERVWIQGRALR